MKPWVESVLREQIVREGREPFSKTEKNLLEGKMNNEKNSIYQEYSQIQEKNQWMVVYQVAIAFVDVLRDFLEGQTLINRWKSQFNRMWRKQAKLRRRNAITR